jgi:hypothetical protein
VKQITNFSLDIKKCDVLTECYYIRLDIIFLAAAQPYHKSHTEGKHAFLDVGEVRVLCPPINIRKSGNSKPHPGLKEVEGGGGTGIFSFT